MTIQKNIIILSAVCALWCTVSVFSADASDLFQQGNAMYTRGDFDSALVCYQSVLDSGLENGPLYFNMGNCYYKSGDIARAVLCYERAKKYLPGDEALKQNMDLAALRVVDKITPMPEFFLVTAARTAVTALPARTLMYSGMAAWVFLVVFIVGCIISRTRRARRICRSGVIFFSAVLVTALACIIAQKNIKNNDRRAVITEPMVEVMSAPSRDEGVEIFTIHSGTVVTIESDRNRWVEIVLADGKVGWMESKGLEEVWPSE